MISIHAPHEGERPYIARAAHYRKDFNPRSPRGGATGNALKGSFARQISIHAPHEGERPGLFLWRSGWDSFQSTLPTRGSDPKNGIKSISKMDFNPRSPRGGATPPQRCAHGDGRYFNPRSPRGGATHLSLLAAPKGGFQSTLPTRGSDMSTMHQYTRYTNFNPRSPRGGATNHGIYHAQRPRLISIHAPHEGERRWLYTADHTANNFNPRSPRGGATRVFKVN